VLEDRGDVHRRRGGPFDGFERFVEIDHSGAEDIGPDALGRELDRDPLDATDREQTVDREMQRAAP